VLTAATLAWSAGSPSTVFVRLLQPAAAYHGSAATEQVVNVVAGLAWLLLLAVLVSAALVAAAAVPGTCGRVASHAALLLLPGAVRRALSLALGVTVLSATSGGLAAAVEVARPPAASAGAPSTFHTPPDLDWPVASTTPSSTSATPGVSRSQAAPALPGDATVVTVRPGDSLWGIARNDLAAARPPSDAEVAVAWPRWWAANRATVGDNPDLLYPGQQLVRPQA